MQCNNRQIINPLGKLNKSKKSPYKWSSHGVAGDRTQDHQLKRLLLYRLSYYPSLRKYHVRKLFLTGKSIVFSLLFSRGFPSKILYKSLKLLVKSRVDLYFYLTSIFKSNPFIDQIYFELSFPCSHRMRSCLSRFRLSPCKITYSSHELYLYNKDKIFTMQLKLLPMKLRSHLIVQQL